MILRKDPYDNLIFTARRSGLWIPQPLRMSPGYPCCCEKEECVDCEYCDDSCGPQEFEIILSGIVNESPPSGGCTGCALFDDTYIVTLHPSACVWNESWSSTGICPSDEDIVLRIEISVAAISVSAETTYSGAMYWELTISTPYDCLGISNLDIPVGTDLSSCDHSSSTCTMTAL